MSSHSEEATAVEIGALKAVAEYGTIQKAADALMVSPHTVDSHLDSLRRKSGLRHLPQLVAWGAHHDWVTIPRAAVNRQIGRRENVSLPGNEAIGDRAS